MKKETRYRGRWTYELRSREPSPAIRCRAGCGREATFELRHASTWGYELSKEYMESDGFYCEEHGLEAMEAAAREFERKHGSE